CSRAGWGIPAEVLATGRNLAGRTSLRGPRPARQGQVSICVSIHKYSVGHGPTTEPAYPAPGRRGGRGVGDDGVLRLLAARAGRGGYRGESAGGGRPARLSRPASRRPV